MKTTITHHIRRLSAALLAATSLAATAAAPVDMDKRAEELKNQKWGMFICWSFSTFSGKEWTPGITDISYFRATDVDTDQWARTAKEAGMGYILFLTKHHDGFCLWDTKTTDRKVTNAPLGKDVLAQLRKSCDKHGIKLALYFSEGEWRHPGGLDHPATPEPKQPNQGGRDPEMKKAQIKELLTQYGPIEYIWFDHAVGDGGLSHAETIAFCKALQPGCFIGFNHGDQTGADIRLGEMGKPGPLTDNSGAGYNKGAPSKNYLLAEFTYPILPEAHEGGAMWFYSLPKHDGLCKPADALYRDYLGAVKFGNVFALDVGPNYEGKLREIDIKTLRQIGGMIRNKVALPEPIPAREILSSTVWGADHEAAKAADNDENTRWGAAPDARSGWLEIDLGKETKIGAAKVMEIAHPRTESFAIEYKSGDEWKPLHQGTTIAGRRSYEFAPVNARFFRLNILKASEVPTIEEFQLLPPAAANK